MEENRKFMFAKGFGSGILAEIVTVLIITIVSLIANGYDMYIWAISFAFLVYGLIIFIPISLIAGDIAKRKGYKRCLIFLAVCIVVVLLSYGTCTGMLMVGRN